MCPVSADCLLAVRKAGSLFFGHHNVRSRIFESLLQRYEAISRQIADERTMLVRELHAAVPLAGSPAERHVLLQIKRKVSNFSPPLENEMDVLSLEQRLKVETYCANLLARETLLDDHRESIFQEFRQQIDALVAGEDFRCAMAYSCPWLIDAFLRHGPGHNIDFSHEERGIYSYATRFFSKANPFHIFARIAFPPYLGLHVDCECEVVVNAKLIRCLETKLLSSPNFKHERSIYLCTFFTENDLYYFFVRDQSSLRQIVVRSKPALELVTEYFNKEHFRHTVGDCIRYLANTLSSTDRSEIERYVFQLIDHGIIVEYLVTDFDHFADNLSGINADYDPVITALQKVHLARMTKHDVLAVERQVKDALAPVVPFEDTAYYVSTYSKENTAQHEQAASRLYGDLEAIKPLFLATNNFADRAYLSSAFIHDQCAARPNQRVPYLELLTDFLADKSSVVSRYQYSSHCPPEMQQKRRAWLQRLQECEGVLSNQQLASLTSERPRSEGYAGNVCFNGPLDAKTGIFYPRNFFAGGGRYVSRYLLSERGNREKRLSRKKDMLDVQLVPAYEDNRFYVAPTLATGCGFDARYRHKFDRWINPANVLVELQEERIIYREDGYGQALRFHFFGFLLGQAVNPEYQLMLTAHADFFYNPFERIPSPSDAIQRIPALYYGSVCLRREQWRIPKTILEPLWKENDILRCTLGLIAFLQESGIIFSNCYFELFDPAKEWSKPRYLDLHNPLSVHAFRRAVRSCSKSAIVLLASMEPPPENLFTEMQSPLVTELMIEV
jgi:hypothetical protein